jgi:hypothetical protein
MFTEDAVLIWPGEKFSVRYEREGLLKLQRVIEIELAKFGPLETHILSKGKEKVIAHE